MSGLSDVCISVPEYRLDKAELATVAQEWLDQTPDVLKKFLHIASVSGVESRNFVIPSNQTFKLSGLEQRSKLFQEQGTAILLKTFNAAVEQSKIDPTTFTYHIFTSCSVPIIPSLDAEVILQSNVPNNICRIPIFQHGCAAGVVGLGLACKLANLGQPVILSSLELCSLVFQSQNHSGAQLVGAAIFADGCASTVITPKNNTLNYLDSESHLIPNSNNIMGYDIFDDGFHLRLARELPSLIVSEMPKVISKFLDKHGLSIEEIDYWLFHPGGKKILDNIEELLNLKSEQTHWARDVLRDYGNMSSATILFVLKKFLSDVKLETKQKVLVVGIGPGMTIELVLFDGKC